MTDQPLPVNSTIVRSNDADPNADVRNTLVVALGLWAGAIAIGMRSDVFARISPETVVALAVFATAFSIAAVTVDVRLREWLDGRRAKTMRFALLGAAALLGTAAAGFADGRLPNLPATPWIPFLLFGLPITAALAVAAFGAAWRAAATVPTLTASRAPAPRRAAA